MVLGFYYYLGFNLIKLFNVKRGFDKLGGKLRGIKYLELITYVCHSGLDPESRLSHGNGNPFHLYSSPLLREKVRIPAFAGMTLVYSNP